MSISSVQSSPSLMSGMPISMSMDYSSANGGMLRRPTIAHMSSLMVAQQAVNLVSHPATAQSQGLTMSEASYGPSSTPQWSGRDSSPLSERHRKDSMERTLNFSTSPHDDEYGYGKKKTAPRDPMSHRIIEKRRRDRMNNCLADLSRLIPASYLRKQGRGRIEKTEIIEMAIKHIRYIQSKLPLRYQNVEQLSPPDSPQGEQDLKDPTQHSTSRSYADGYKDCFVEVLQYLVDVEGFFAGEGICARLINHTQNTIDRMGHDIDLREHLPRDLLNPLKHMRDRSLESESRSTLRKEQEGRQHDKEGSRQVVSPKNSGHRGRALSQSDIGGIRITSDYDSEAELQQSGTSSHNSCNSPNSTPGSASTLHAGDAHSSSQLREMLQSPFNTWSRNYRPVNGGPSSDTKGQTAITPEPEATLPMFDSGDVSPISTSTKDLSDSTSPSTNSYSFKRTIKERFATDVRRGSCDPDFIKVEVDSETGRGGLMGKRRPDSRSSGSNDCSDMGGSFESLPAGASHKRRASEPAPVTGLAPMAGTVPIFALHSSGAYYVPSSINVHLIEFDQESTKGGPAICHPVTINVNFSASASTRAASGNTLTVPSALTPASIFPRPLFHAQQSPAAGQPALLLPSVLPFTTSVAGGNGGSTLLQPYHTTMSGPNLTAGNIQVHNNMNGGHAILMPRRASLNIAASSSRDGHTTHHHGLHYGYGGPVIAGPMTIIHGPPSSATSSTAPASATSSHVLNLSQSHSRS
ncbi:hypothetical protein RvY_14990 [Ramazzottius varieornatus]|uniref:BHLH domain-containing protein n=1 Tax=Ramazzottius varieornatus TaxID=947166 RepID=A0A1D1VWX4_RAMVA|nr:hypothetical protein RvY_14990 [Ramazzottius varieornatus]